MLLHLHNLVPEPLQDHINLIQSGVWNRDISLKEGTLNFVHAPSGSGKTTLMHILYGLRTDYSGIVKWGNQLMAGVNQEEVAELRRSKVSIVFQDMRLFPELTALENIDVKRVLTATTSPEEVNEWMAHLGISTKKNTPVRIMSYGEQQRVAIIRALVQPFRWILLDEPFSHLDKQNSMKAAQLIQDVVTRQGAGMILADLDENSFFNYHQSLAL